MEVKMLQVNLSHFDLVNMVAGCQVDNSLVDELQKSYLGVDWMNGGWKWDRDNLKKKTTVTLYNLYQKLTRHVEGV